MIVRFWGTRGSIPTPGHATSIFGGNTTCVEIEAGEELLIFDAGSGLRELGSSLNKRFRNKSIRASLFISHTHWDHIQGLPSGQVTTSISMGGSATPERPSTNSSKARWISITSRFLYPKWPRP